MTLTDWPMPLKISSATDVGRIEEYRIVGAGGLSTLQKVRSQNGMCRKEAGTGTAFTSAISWTVRSKVYYAYASSQISVQEAEAP